MGEKRRVYPEELKRNALKMIEETGKSAASVARELGIDSGLLTRWRREAKQEPEGKTAFTGHGVPRDEELAQLRKEVEDLQETNEILKKAVAIFSVERDER